MRFPLTGLTHARDAFFLLRGFTGGSLPASAPVSLMEGGAGDRMALR